MKKIMKNIKLLCLTLIILCITGTLTSCDSEDSDVLLISVANNGNGYTWAEKIAEKFQAETGIKVKVKGTAVQTIVDTSLPSGPKNNEIDIYFPNSIYYSVIARGKNYVKGFDYETAILDISDVYDYEVTGYGEGMTLRDILSETAIEACTYVREGSNLDGRQYFVPHLTNTTGIIYNRALFAQNNYSVPLTTDSLIQLCEDIKADHGKGTYAMVYAGNNGYSRYVGNVWWAQYEGKDNFENYWKGIYDGSYADGYKNFAQQGRKETAIVLDSLFDASNAYSRPESVSNTFTQAQLSFLEGEAFMTISGDWIENEMKGNFATDSLDIAIMKTPVLSAMSTKLSYYADGKTEYNNLSADKKAKYNAALEEIIKYVDGTVTEKPTSVGGLTIKDSDIEIVRNARITKSAPSAGGFICAYSNKIEEAKKFMAYIFNKDCQEIMLQETNGAYSALKADYPINYFDSFNNLSKMQKAKLDLVTTDVIEVSTCHNHPMSYSGGLVQEWYTGSGAKFEGVVGLPHDSKSYKSGLTIFEDTYKHYANGNTWVNMLKNAGLFNE